MSNIYSVWIAKTCELEYFKSLESAKSRAEEIIALYIKDNSYQLSGEEIKMIHDTFDDCLDSFYFTNVGRRIGIVAIETIEVND